VPDVNEASLTQAARAGTKWIVDNVQEDGRFIYYYDAATDTRRDHEHPGRDPEIDPYYNLLRHCGGVITLLLEEQLWRARIAPPSKPYDGLLSPSNSQDGRTDLLARPSQNGPGDPFYDTCTADGSPSDDCGEPPYDSGGDRRRQTIEQTLDFFVRQLVEYKTADGQKAAYALYNRKAKLGGSGVGLCALAMYQHRFDDDRYAGSAERLAKHLISEINDQGEFRYYRLMMGVNDLWDVAEFQQDEYKTFVFGDADQMVRLMYTEEDALYPDYVGSFYYRYGDHPYPDGARAEGLLAAYQLALKVGDEARHNVRMATLRLCNTPESMYSAANPKRAIGGIRFKLTRQWFRVDTIQHVASFYLKLVAMDSP